MAKAHLIFGAAGMAKTAYGRTLAEDHSAALFVIDEWMATLFGPDAPTPPSPEWSMARADRCEQQIWAVARQLLALGTDVALDLGFATRAQRDRVRALASNDKFMVRTHVLDGSEKITEPLGEDELRGATVVKTR